ncbi:L-fucose:H+ symporter permease [Sphingobium sp. CR2-8]|uniref:L-fucose:H+ symporter permease n=1 Tax=Sphingobium sp. CR2-8 TaxID=1306534 RepID=UPI002DBF5EE6|nr:L-fucose:H+ symporter permease [Sphingobium sp. CR2-8]MEC3909288.1 L-fucose:H+ symporter permease [Sphingobium sp. CR2-8]
MPIQCVAPQTGGERGSAMAMTLTIGLFFLWGVANNLNDVLIAHFRHVFSLSDFQSGLVQSAFYLGYFCFAIPAALAAERLGYKATVIMGLLLFGGGALLFLPASIQLSYGFFLFALFVIASGLAFLETAANPMVAVMGPADRSAQRLNLAQAFNPLGSITGVALGATLILSDAPERGAAGAAAVLLPYLGIAIVVLAWAAALAFTRFPPMATQAERGQGAALAGYGALLRRPRYVAGVVAQFFYVGAQVGIWSYLIRYAQHAVPGIGAQNAAWLLTLSLALFMIGRFAGAALLARFDGARLMALFAGFNIALSLVAVAGGVAGLAALVATSFFMSIMYPTIFALSLRDLGPLTKAGASMIVMAIIGGAILTMAMGLLSDLVGTIRAAMLVPAFCFIVVALYARAAAQREAVA